jgi:DNA-binding MarR family transcriptional regulator
VLQEPNHLEAHLGYWLRCLSNHVSLTFTSRLEKHGVSVPQWVVLRVLYQKQPCSLNDLAAVVPVDKGALSRMVERLVKRGLVTRETPATNRRMVSLALTPAGNELVPRLAKEADENDAAFFGSLSETQRLEFLTTIKNLIAANQSDRLGAPIS